MSFLFLQLGLTEIDRKRVLYGLRKMHYNEFCSFAVFVFLPFPLHCTKAVEVINEAFHKCGRLKTKFLSSSEIKYCLNKKAAAQFLN